MRYAKIFQSNVLAVPQVDRFDWKVVMTRLLFLILCLAASVNSNTYFAADTSNYSIEDSVFVDVGEDSDPEPFDFPATQDVLSPSSLPEKFSPLPNAWFVASEPGQSYTIRAPPEFSSHS